MKTVRDACQVEDNALSIKLSDQIEQLDELRRIEQEKIAKLRQLASDWREANEIRAFLAIVQERAPTAGEELREWIAWGLRVADHLDPIATLGEGPAPSS